MAFKFPSRRKPADAAGRKSEKQGSIWRFLLTLAIGAWLIRSVIISSSYIPSGSMLPTMAIGDYLFVSKWPYGYSSASFPWGVPSFSGRFFGGTPQRGDIIVFKGPEGHDVVKRVIGLPGELISVRDGVVSIDGKPLKRERIENFALTVSPNSPCRQIRAGGTIEDSGTDPNQHCIFPAYRETLPNGRTYVTLDQIGDGEADNYGPQLVPQGHVFLMGDNRDDSLDSRYEPPIGMGMVPVDHIVGRAQYVFWSTDGSSSWINPVSWFQALRGERMGTDFHP